MEMNNKGLLSQLIEEDLIRITEGEIFSKPHIRKPDDFDFDRIEGMMLGLAIGDALGNTTEVIPPEVRLEEFGEIRDYIPTIYSDFQAIGLPSDDSQLAFLSLEQMNIDRGFIPQNIASRFCVNKIFGTGSTVRRFIENSRNGRYWYRCGTESAGNGALMRIAPMVIPHLRSDDSGLWADTAISAMITHNDTFAISSCVSFINMIWQILDMKEVKDPKWWVDTYVSVAKDIEKDKRYRVRGGWFSHYEGPAWKFIQDKVLWAYNEGLTVGDACDAWHSGPYLLETIPCVLYILMRHGDNIEEAIIRAVNDTYDNDTIGAIVGAVLGALYGKKSIPKRWIDNLSGKTTEWESGNMFSILDDAKYIWWEGSEDDRLNSWRYRRFCV